LTTDNRSVTIRGEMTDFRGTPIPQDPTQAEVIAALRTSRQAFGYVVWSEHDGHHIQLVKSHLIEELQASFDSDEPVRAVISDDSVVMG